MILVLCTRTFDHLAELLKKKYDKSRNECVKSRADVEMLKSKLLEMSNDLDMVKNERDQLGRDAETFER